MLMLVSFNMRVELGHLYFKNAHLLFFSFLHLMEKYGHFEYECEAEKQTKNIRWKQYQ